ncbi:coproporphyrinogen III oxidase family protein [Campylobacter sp. FMV-PI01]|uniref:Heme chaperone HemW n=1 Tax=Campylobacter portucalensis TaxID=2608384 RepID=A0A6L5WKQ0_9BACT|nr:radical SAM family heme chaperone HemW [Campylobacter portucalensis]MSN96982.1 coproporphyrinogen III oxidase family protein [Campylobacter portucalensis]
MHIYIHIPFCSSKCPYCAFGSSTDSFNLVERYFEALLFEIKNSTLNKISTIFIGGGTPSVISAKFYEKIFDEFRDFLDIKTEITTEANPNSATLKWLKDMKNLGVNRVSFGTQSFNDEKLKFLGRNHSSIHTKKAVLNAKKVGFKNINVDIIYDTKFDDKKMIEFELLNLAKLDLTHISAYSLTLEENTPFYNKSSFKKDSVNLAKFLFLGLENLGFKQYEISNFGQICKHNLAYWQGKNYLGFGAYAVGFKDDKRFYSPKDIKSYIKNPTFKNIENLTKSDLKFEKIFLGMRSKIGVEAKILNELELKRAKILVEEKKLSYKNERFYNQDYLLSDEIVLFLVEI